MRCIYTPVHPYPFWPQFQYTPCNPPMRFRPARPPRLLPACHLWPWGVQSEPIRNSPFPGVYPRLNSPPDSCYGPNDFHIRTTPMYRRPRTALRLTRKWLFYSYNGGLEGPRSMDIVGDHGRKRSLISDHHRWKIHGNNTNAFSAKLLCFSANARTR